MITGRSHPAILCCCLFSCCAALMALLGAVKLQSDCAVVKKRKQQLCSDVGLVLHYGILVKVLNCFQFFSLNVCNWAKFSSFYCECWDAFVKRLQFLFWLLCKHFQSPCEVRWCSLEAGEKSLMFSLVFWVAVSGAWPYWNMVLFSCKWCGVCCLLCPHQSLRRNFCCTITLYLVVCIADCRLLQGCWQTTGIRNGEPISRVKASAVAISRGLMDGGFDRFLYLLKFLHSCSIQGAFLAIFWFCWHF